MKKMMNYVRILCLVALSLLLQGFVVDVSCWTPPADEAVAEAPTPEETAPEEATTPGNTAPEVAPPSNTYRTLYALNLRPAPNTNAARIALAQAGARVEVLSRYGAWYNVRFNGLVGYMYADFLAPAPELFIPPPDLGNLAPVEMIYWNAASALLGRFEPLTIIDVRTGLTWQMARFGGDAHADVEPITAQDTAIMHRAFNYTWTWTPRPVLVLIHGRTLAASLNGMPHGMVTNHQNNVNGHFCLHFFGSRTHGTWRLDTAHQNAVHEAFFTASAWDGAVPQ